MPRQLMRLSLRAAAMSAVRRHQQSANSLVEDDFPMAAGHAAGWQAIGSEAGV